jgi:hypothetical protein
VVDRRPVTGAVPQSRVARPRPGASLPGMSSYSYGTSFDGVDRGGLKAALVADALDNGPTPVQYEAAALASHANVIVT